MGDFGQSWSALLNCGEVWWLLVWFSMAWHDVVVVYNCVWYGVWTTLANGKEGRRRASHEDVHLSFLKVLDKRQSRPPADDGPLILKVWPITIWTTTLSSSSSSAEAASPFGNNTLTLIPLQQQQQHHYS